MKNGGFAYFNPRTPCGVRPEHFTLYDNPFLISIHAPLAGCDFVTVETPKGVCGFQSTHPLRGATPSNARAF